LVPDRKYAGKPSDWFLWKFDFITDPSLRKQLAEAFYQARMAEKLRAALGLKGGFNHTFVKTQVILYASIYEAVVDWLLEGDVASPEVQEMLRQEFYQPASEALGKNTRVVIAAADGNEEVLVLCRKKQRNQKLKEIQFKERLATAVTRKLVPGDLAPVIDRLYTSRNRVHLGQAAAEEFAPDPNQTSEAFQSMSRFLKHASQVKPYAKA
jgi:hypothetical protein